TAFGIELRGQRRDAVQERNVLLEKMVEVARNGRVDRISDRGSTGVEIDEDRGAGLREGEREIDRESRLADASLSRRDGEDPFQAIFYRFSASWRSQRLEYARSRRNRERTNEAISSGREPSA